MSNAILQTIVNAFYKWENAQNSFNQQLALREFKRLMKLTKDNLEHHEPDTRGTPDTTV